uniref:AMIN-like domain-containing (lipo)protein n=1 Tax=Parafrankia elaeagni TaxID=222534 RepID=UPI0003636241|nr:hypothetical protein [Parafrankia elaeagni]
MFEFDGGLPGYELRYVPEVRSPGRGAPIDLRGAAFVEVRFRPATTHDSSGVSTLRTARDGGGMPALCDYQFAGGFEGYVRYGLGLEGTVPYRVTELAHPSRIAVDIAA